MTAVQAQSAADSASAAQPSWKIKLLYDGACPLCLHEVNMLTKKDAGRGLVAFVDVDDDSYDPAENGGVDFETAMGVIHAVLPDGTVIKNVEVFRQVYDVLGMGWIYAITKLPVIGSLADALYGIWAKWRLKVTGRSSLAEVIAAREQRLAAACDEGGRCRVEE